VFSEDPIALRLNLKERKLVFSEDRQCTYKITLRRVSWNHCYSGKAIIISYSEYVFAALDMPHEMRARHIVICGLPGSTTFFSHYLINGTIFGKKVIEYKMCVLIFFTIFSETFLSL
jgi:hypothetical protein